MISKAEYPDVDINQILFANVGLIKDSAYADVFLEWFPKSESTIMYDSNEKSSFYGLNKNEAILCSIINKAQQYVDIEAIAENWKRKVFDYESKMLKDMIPFGIGFTTLLLISLFVVFTLFIKNKRMRQ